MSLVEINWRPGRQQLRVFGLSGLAAFSGLGTWLYFRHSLLGMHLAPSTSTGLALVLGSLGLFCGASALFVPPVLRPLYVVLTVISIPIGVVVSHVVMAILYYGIFTPLGLLFRIIGRDPLNRSFQPSEKTYWMPREQVTDLKRYFRQY